MKQIAAMDVGQYFISIEIDISWPQTFGNNLETKIQDERLWQLPKSAQIAQYLTFKLCAERKEQVGGIIRSLATFYSASTAGVGCGRKCAEIMNSGGEPSEQPRRQIF